MDAYRSGDPYLAFAKQAGAAPPDATKATHKAIRDQFKSAVLAVQYGMGADAPAQRIGQPPVRARELLRLHRETYRVFWRWSDAAVDYAMLNGHLPTVFGWHVHVAAEANAHHLLIAREGSRNPEFLLLPIDVRQAMPRRGFYQPTKPNGRAENELGVAWLVASGSCAKCRQQRAISPVTPHS